MNLWAESKPVEEFVLGQKLGRIASELMGVGCLHIVCTPSQTILSLLLYWLIDILLDVTHRWMV